MICYDGLVSRLYGAQIRRIPQESFREIVTRKRAEATVVRIVQRVRPNDVVGIVSQEDWAIQKWRSIDSIVPRGLRVRVVNISERCEVVHQ